LLIAVGLTVIVAGPILYEVSPREPSYQGKSLSVWIAPFCVKTRAGFDAPAGPAHFEELQPVRHAVSAMGTNARPFLSARLKARETSLHRMLRKLTDKQPFAALRMADPAIERVRAIRGLAVLGPRAKSSIPDLVPYVGDPALAPHAVYALAEMPPEGLRALADQLTNRNMVVRMQVAGAFLSAPFSALQGSAPGRADVTLNTNELPEAVMVAALARIVQDTTSPFRAPAVQRLGMLGPAASEAVPGLVPILEEPNFFVREIAIHALGSIRARPELVVPALSNHLSDPNPGTRMAVVSALRVFGCEARFEPFVPGQPGTPGALFSPGGSNYFHNGRPNR
jgi:hypothetical protein